MKSINFSFLLFTIILFTKKSIQDEDTEKIISGLYYFKTKMTKALYKPGENLLFSPFNLYIALSQLHLATNGTTRDEISQLLQNQNIETSKFHQSLHELITEIQKPVTTEKEKIVDVKLADAIFVHNDISLKKSFQENVNTYYKSDIINVDFIANGEEATKTINQYVANKTENRISPLLTEPVSGDTRIVLVDTLYFNALWDAKFDNSKTQDGNITVKMMEKTEDTRYAKIPDFNLEVAEIKYVKSSFALYIILPLGDRGIGDIHANLLSSENLKKIFFEREEEVELHLKLPRTIFKWSQDIKQGLVNVGIEKLFTEAADLTNMVDSKLLKVTEFYHATDIKITEDGTEAAAASASKISYRSGRYMRKVNFVVNKPFVITLFHRKTDIPLFQGIVNYPGSG